MACKRCFIVAWSAHADGTPAGQAEYTYRYQANGFAMIRRAMGFKVTISEQ